MQIVFPQGFVLDNYNPGTAVCTGAGRIGTTASTAAATTGIGRTSRTIAINVATGATTAVSSGSMTGTRISAAATTAGIIGGRSRNIYFPTIATIGARIRDDIRTRFAGTTAAGAGIRRRTAIAPLVALTVCAGAAISGSRGTAAGSARNTAVPGTGSAHRAAAAADSNQIPEYAVSAVAAVI